MKKILLCGYGYWGKNLARVLYQLGVLSAICDTNVDNLAKAAAAYPNIVVYTKFDAALRSNVDAVVIVTPPKTHFILGYQALMAQKHVFVEKPMTTSLADATQLAEYALRQNRILQVGHTFLFNSGIRKMKEYIHTGELGNIKYIDIQQVNLGKFQSGGVILDLAAHGLSIADYLLGYPNSKVKDVNTSKASFMSPDLVDWANIVVNYEKGALLNLNISWLHPKKIRRFTVVGDEKMVIFDDINEPRIQLIDKSIRLEESVSCWGNSMANYTVGNIIIPTIKFEEPIKEEMKHFIQCIEKNEQPITNGVHGVRVMDIMERVL